MKGLYENFTQNYTLLDTRWSLQYFADHRAALIITFFVGHNLAYLARLNSQLNFQY